MNKDDITKTETDYSALKVLFGVFLTSVASIPILHLLTFYLDTMENAVNNLLVGVILCFLLVPIFYYLLVIRGLKNYNGSIFLYVFSIFAFTAVVDFVLALTIDGYVSTMKYYLTYGEPYMNTAHGALINYWDGTVHYSFYLCFSYWMVKQVDFRYSGLYWVGSIGNSMIPLLAGGIIGKHGGNTQWSIFLNVPYVVFPILFGIQIIRKHRSYTIIGSNDSKSKRELDYCLIFGYSLLTLISFIRFFGAMKSDLPIAKYWVQNIEPYLLDPNGFSKMQMISLAYFGVAYFLTMIYSLINEQDEGMIDYVAIFSGAMAQSQFSHIGSSLKNLALNPEPTFQPVPDTYFSIFLAVNLLFFIIPNYHLYRLVNYSRIKLTKFK